MHYGHSLSLMKEWRHQAEGLEVSRSSDPLSLSKLPSFCRTPKPGQTFVTLSFEHPWPRRMASTVFKELARGTGFNISINTTLRKQPNTNLNRIIVYNYSIITQNNYSNYSNTHIWKTEDCCITFATMKKKQFSNSCSRLTPCLGIYQEFMWRSTFILLYYKCVCLFKCVQEHLCTHVRGVRDNLGCYPQECHPPLLT